MKTFYVWVQTDVHKSSITWEAVTPKLTRVSAELIRILYQNEYPNKWYVVSEIEPKD